MTYGFGNDDIEPMPKEPLLDIDLGMQNIEHRDGAMLVHGDGKTLKQLCIDLEHFETPEWAARMILEKEIVTPFVVDPCCGAGILSKVARDYVQEVLSYDVYDWGFLGTITIDWLEKRVGTFEYSTCFMNPPFSLATQFVERAIEQKFRKIICFQRFAWYESQRRQSFWDRHPPNRVWICGDRAHCWRHDIPRSERNSSTPTAHAWFVWDRDAPAGTLLGRIYKS